MNGAVIFLWLLSALFAGMIGLPLFGFIRRRWHVGLLWLQGGCLFLEGIGFYVAATMWKGNFLEGSIVFLLVMIINCIADSLYEAGKQKGI